MNISITRTQLFFLIIKTQIGIGLLSLPSEIQSSAKGNAWISVLVAGCAIQLLLLVYWHLYKQYPQHTLSQITVRVFGAPIGKTLNFVYFLSFIMIAGYACTLYVQLVHNWMLTLTPAWALLLLIIGTGIYLALENLRVIARFFVLASTLFVILLLVSLLTFTNDMHITNLLPLSQSGMKEILKGSEKTFFSLLGFEVILFFFAQVESSTSRGLLGVVSLANGFVTLFYTYFVVICLIGFNPPSLEQMNEPVLYLFKGLTFQLFDRLDLIFLTIWIIPMTATIVSYLCIAGKSLTTSQSSYRKMIGVTGGLVFLLASYLSTREDLKSFSKWMEYGYLVMIAALPILMWSLTLLLKNNAKRGQA